MSGAVVLLAAGDIAMCGPSGDEATAAIVDSVLRADSVANLPTVVVTMGDNAYPSGARGSNNIFARCFAPSWGSRRIMDALRPSPGNHDFENSSGAGYYSYFGDRAGPAGKGYYSFDIGKWHVISLNSELVVNRRSSREAIAQEEWLRADLRDHGKPCTLASFHHPLFTSGPHGPSIEMESVWHVLYEAGVDIVLDGHEHHYERFLPQTPLGAADSVKGIVEIVAGTGGSVLRGVSDPPAPNSAARVHGYFGVLKLTLGDGEYRHAFLDTSGRVWDRGAGKCH